MNLQSALDRIVDAEYRHGDVHEVALGVLEGGAFKHACRGDWQGRPVGPDTPFLIASTSKLLITAMLLQLVGEGRLVLDDPIVRFFGADELDGLHVWQGRDLSARITLRHLLTHTSGLPDYFEGTRRDGSSLAVELFAGRDRSFGLTEVLAWARTNLKPAPPMLLVTSRAEDEDVVAGLDAGADDYLPKPLSKPVLAARINALIRRAYAQPVTPGIETYDDIVFHEAAGSVARNGETIAL
jgi:hypothetical protein